ncbi:hypothetical protein CCR79_05575 [Halorhodospira halophila]|nr:hypothetical protein [Halorhodospira halophila]
MPMSHGERHPRARATDETVERARYLHDQGLSTVEIARRLGYHYFTVCDWIRYRTRTRLTGDVR